MLLLKIFSVQQTSYINRSKSKSHVVCLVGFFKEGALFPPRPKPPPYNPDMSHFSQGLLSVAFLT